MTCAEMAPVVHGLEKKWGEQVNFVFLDIADKRTKTIKRALGYSYYPQFFLLDGEGTILNQWIGLVGEEELDAALADATG